MGDVWWHDENKKVKKQLTDGWPSTGPTEPRVFLKIPMTFSFFFVANFQLFTSNLKITLKWKWNESEIYLLDNRLFPIYLFHAVLPAEVFLPEQGEHQGDWNLTPHLFVLVRSPWWMNAALLSECKQMLRCLSGMHCWGPLEGGWIVAGGCIRMNLGKCIPLH